MSVIAADNYTRANESPMTGNWTSVFGTINLTSNEAVAGGLACSRWNADSFPDDQYAEIVVASLASSWVGPAVRCASSGQYLYFLVCDASNKTYYRIVNGSWNAVGSAISDATSVSDTIRLKVEGTTLTGYSNGTPLAARSDSQIASGVGGIVMGASGGAVDDWEGGNLTAGGTTVSVGKGALNYLGKPVLQRIELKVDPGTFNFSGKALTSSLQKDIVVNVGSFQLVGKTLGVSTTALPDTTISIDSGKLYYNGKDVTTTIVDPHTRLAIAAGTFRIDGKPLSASVSEVLLSIGKGTLNLTGKNVSTDVVGAGKSAASRLYVLDLYDKQQESNYVHLDWTIRPEVKQQLEELGSKDDPRPDIENILSKDRTELRRLDRDVRKLEKRLSSVKTDTKKAQTSLALAAAEAKKSELQSEVAMLQYQLQLMEEDEIIMMVLA
jgi:hypothetical protein